MAEFLRSEAPSDALPGQAQRVQQLPDQIDLYDFGARARDQPRDRPLAAFRSRTLSPRHRLLRSSFGGGDAAGDACQAALPADLLVLIAVIAIALAAGRRWRAICGVPRPTLPGTWRTAPRWKTRRLAVDCYSTRWGAGRLEKDAAT